MAEEDGITIRPWEPRDREHVQDLLRSQEAKVSSDDVPSVMSRQLRATTRGRKL